MEHEPDDDRPLLRSTRLPPVTAAAPPSSLDDHGRRGQELRDALEELRADLDGRPASPRPPVAAPATAAASVSAPAAAARSGSSAASAGTGTPAMSIAPPASTRTTLGRWRLGRPRTRLSSVSARRLATAALGGVVVLVGVPLVVRVVAWSVTGAHEPGPSSASPRSAPSPSASPPAVGAATSGPRAGTSVASSPPSARPAVVLPPGLPRSGPGADVPGAELTAVVEPAGTLVVYERLVVRTGTTSVRLAPAPAQELPSGLGGAAYTVTGLQVAVDGRAVTPDAEGSGWRVSPSGGFTQLAVRYRLSGAVVRTSPAPPGRATLVLRPLTGPEASRAHDPVLVRLNDPRVGQVYCPLGPQPLCDTARGALHVATVPAGSRPVVLAQVTLH